MCSPVIQRTVDTDIQNATEALDNTKLYQESVMKGLDKYTKVMKELDTSENEQYESIAAKMASGLKAWAQNYFNKSQAYLYEGQKAADFTRTNMGQFSFGILGVDTDKNPDLEVHTLSEKQGWASSAVEFKASTTGNYASVDKLLGEGLEQLKKRELHGDEFQQKFSKLLLTIHNDNAENMYPLSPTEFERRYAGIVGDVDWNFELRYRIDQKVKKLAFKTPVEIRLEHKGKRYATVLFK